MNTDTDNKVQADELTFSKRDLENAVKVGVFVGFVSCLAAVGMILFAAFLSKS